MRHPLLRRVIVAAAAIVLAATPTGAAAQVTGFGPIAFDIDAAPDGSILVASADGTVNAVRDGAVTPMAGVPLPATDPPTTLNGIEAIGRGTYFATTGGGDLATGAKVWHVSQGRATVVGDVEAFETAHDPDSNAGLQWKDPACEEAPPSFTAGPQSNPYHLTAASGSTALVADAAGNTLLAASTSGAVELVATFTPPVVGGGASTDPDDWMVLFSIDADTRCYVQPVPTSVAVGPDGAYYVGELTGATAALTDAPGLSRVWKIAPGARDVVCPSAACELVVSGLTSVIDIEFGPDGLLYIVEYDLDGWLSALIDFELDGAIKACDVWTGACSVVAGGLALPGAITFDGSGTLWLLEGNLIGPILRTVDIP